MCILGRVRAAAVALTMLSCTGTIQSEIGSPDAPSGSGFDGGVVIDAPPLVDDAGHIIILDARLTLDARPGTTPDARPPGPVVFPVHVEGRHLVDASGKPFLLQGDSAWSMIVQLNDADLELYLSDRQAKGFNTLLVELLEHCFSDHPPNDVFGNAPFTTPGDFSTPNPAYFAHVDAVLERARSHGFLVLLAFAYLGFNGGDEGWYQELSAQGETKLRNYGAFLGARYRDQPNIVWVAGGDYNPPNRSIVIWMVEGIATQDTQHLVTVHCVRETGALEYWGDQSWVDLDNVYTGTNLAAEVALAYTRSTLPFFLIEAQYEFAGGPSAQVIRAQAYGTLLAGGMGHFFGNGPIWCFGTGNCFGGGSGSWKEQLNSRGARDMATLRGLFDTLPWSTFVPTPGLVASNGAGTVASLASNGTVGTIYIPSSRTFSVNLSLMSGTTRGFWFDPVGGGTSAAGGPWANSGTQSLTTPGANGGGDGDWVLLLDAR